MTDEKTYDDTYDAIEADYLTNNPEHRATFPKTPFGYRFTVAAWKEMFNDDTITTAEGDLDEAEMREFAGDTVNFLGTFAAELNLYPGDAERLGAAYTIARAFDRDAFENYRKISTDRRKEMGQVARNDGDLPVH